MSSRSDRASIILIMNINPNSSFLACENAPAEAISDAVRIVMIMNIIITSASYLVLTPPCTLANEHALVETQSNRVRIEIMMNNMTTSA